MKGKLLQVPAPYLPFCLIATITYGTPYYTKINIFRKFRDKILIKKFELIGYFFVKFYYLLSFRLIWLVKVKMIQIFLLIFLIKPILEFYYKVKE